MKRRTLLQSSLALAAPAIASIPAIARAATSTLNFVPLADLTSLDPVHLAPDVTVQHGHAVFDMLYGLDTRLEPHPQMIEGHVIENDGRTWRLTLRPGLRFHDGEPVRAQDAVASLRRWARIDSFGVKLFSVTDELAALSDRVLQFRLKRPFPLLPAALAKPATYSPHIMPQRLVEAAGTGPITEMTGSGPFRYLADERMVGSRVVYGKFDGYLPRQEPGDWHAGGRIAYFDRVVWNVIPDASTAAGALRKGEVDWWDNPPDDLGPVLRADPNLRVEVKDIIGGEPILRFNALHPPFDNPRIRHAVLVAVKQSEFMQALSEDRSLWHDRVGVWSLNKPMSTDAGVDVMAGDIEGAKRLLAEAGYKGERVALLATPDFPSLYTMALIAADLLKRIGMNVDVQTVDYGTQTQRRGNRTAPDQGGWSIYFTWFSGTNRFDPAAHLGITSTYFGWPSLPEIDALRDQWFEAPDLAAQRDIARRIQLLVWRDAPYIPLGNYSQLTAYKRSLTGISRAGTVFYNVKPA